MAELGNSVHIKASVAMVQLSLANAQLCRFWKSVAQKLSGAILPSTRLHQLWLKSQLVDGSHLYLDFNYLSQIYRLDSSCNCHSKTVLSPISLHLYLFPVWSQVLGLVSVRTWAFVMLPSDWHWFNFGEPSWSPLWMKKLVRMARLSLV